MEELFKNIEFNLKNNTDCFEKNISTYTNHYLTFKHTYLSKIALESNFFG